MHVMRSSRSWICAELGLRTIIFRTLDAAWSCDWRVLDRCRKVGEDEPFVDVMSEEDVVSASVQEPRFDDVKNVAALNWR